MTIDELVKSPLLVIEDCGKVTHMYTEEDDQGNLIKAEEKMVYRTNYQFTQPNGEVLAGYAVIDADLLDLQEEPSQFIAQERHALMECLLQEINRKEGK